MSVVFVKVFSKCTYDLYKDWEALVLLDEPLQLPLPVIMGVTQAFPKLDLQIGRNSWSSFLKGRSCKAFRA